MDHELDQHHESAEKRALDASEAGVEGPTLEENAGDASPQEVAAVPQPLTEQELADRTGTRRKIPAPNAKARRMAARATARKQAESDRNQLPIKLGKKARKGKTLEEIARIEEALNKGPAVQPVPADNFQRVERTRRGEKVVNPKRTGKPKSKPIDLRTTPEQKAAWHARHDRAPRSKNGARRAVPTVEAPTRCPSCGTKAWGKLSFPTTSHPGVGTCFKGCGEPYGVVWAQPLVASKTPTPPASVDDSASTVSTTSTRSAARKRRERRAKTRARWEAEHPTEAWVDKHSRRPKSASGGSYQTAQTSQEQPLGQPAARLPFEVAVLPPLTTEDPLLDSALSDFSSEEERPTPLKPEVFSVAKWFPFIGRIEWGPDSVARAAFEKLAEVELPDLYYYLKAKFLGVPMTATTRKEMGRHARQWIERNRAELSEKDKYALTQSAITAALIPDVFDEAYRQTFRNEKVNDQVKRMANAGAGDLGTNLVAGVIPWGKTTLPQASKLG